MSRAHNVTAVLGPTNTGKTHLAVERMLASPSGMIGLPLRLLAREVYDKVAARCGPDHVALITGEEKIVPRQPRYWVATVEAMPSDLDVSFLAIDEVQLAADRERGHTFTDRILHRRGRDETMLLGSDTMRAALGEIIPAARFVSRPRFSHLTFAGQKKISRLPRRSAIVAFSAEAVYALAELIRRQRGGAAVVLGALSPRTRNAQVELYQSGDVDYLVATDAIGMGLNMDVDHVAFAATRKFDGFVHRALTPAELAQIAGRAGRHTSDGTFGVTGDARPFDAETIERLEEHRFEPVKVLQWRNRALDYSTLDSLRASLNRPARARRLTRARMAADVIALDTLSRDPAIVERASDVDRVRLLWEVCQLPDYRNITSGEHAGLVARIFTFLTGPSGRIDDDWFARQLSYCERTDGDIDTLSNRISHVRTWTYVTNRANWLADAEHWRQRSRAIEDRLSDVLHEKLTQRFIDRRTSLLLKRMRRKEQLMSQVDSDGVVLVEGENAGTVRGLRFFSPGDSADGKAFNAAASAAAAREIAHRAEAICAAPDPDFSLTASGEIVWQDQVIARLVTGPAILRPDVHILSDDLLDAALRDLVAARLLKFVCRHFKTHLAPLFELSEDETLSGLARGLAYRLVENLGIMARDDIAADVKALDQDMRAGLRKHGVRFGAFHVFVPALLKPAPTAARVLLWALAPDAGEARPQPADLPAIPGQGLTSIAADDNAPQGFLRLVGFAPCGPRAVRIDMLERLADMVRDRVFWRPRAAADSRPAGSVEGGGFIVIPDMMSLVGCSGEEFRAILLTLGFLPETRRADKVIAALPTPTPGNTASGEAGGDGNQAGGTTPDQPQPVVAAPGDGVDNDAAIAPLEGDAQPVTLEVWWPKDTGPFRPRKPARGARKRKAPASDGAPSHPSRQKSKRGHQPDRHRRQAKPARSVDRDSPFAVLAALKEDLAGSS